MRGVEGRQEDQSFLTGHNQNKETATYVKAQRRKTSKNSLSVLRSAPGAVDTG